MLQMLLLWIQQIIIRLKKYEDMIFQYECEKYFPMTFNKRLQQLLSVKTKWIKLWKDGIYQCKKRTKVDAARKTLLLETLSPR